jgi:hypothetical protein
MDRTVAQFMAAAAAGPRPDAAPPRWLFQKWNNRSTVPSKVYLQAARYAPGYTHVVLGEDDANAYMAITATATAAKYKQLKNMAHRADVRGLNTDPRSPWSLNIWMTPNNHQPALT